MKQIRFIRDFFKSYGLILSFLFFASLFFVLERKLDSYIIVAFSAFCFLTLPLKRYFNKPAVILLLFSILYGILLSFNGISPGWVFAICNFISPVAFLIFGMYVVDKSKSEDHFLLFIFLLTLVPCIQLFQMVAVDIRDVGIVNPRRLIENLDDENAIAATLYGVVASLSVSALPIISCRREIRSLFYYLFIGIGFIGVLINIHFVNRTFILALATAIVLILMYQSKSNRFVYLFTVALAGIIYLFINDTSLINADVYDAYSFRADNSANVASGGGRLTRWGMVISSMFSNPFGNNNADELLYAHNLWLDVIRQTGIFPCILLLGITWTGYSSLRKLLIVKKDAISFVLLSLTTINFVYCMAEPVIEGIPLYFYLFCMLIGFNIQTYSKFQIR